MLDFKQLICESLTLARKGSLDYCYLCRNTSNLVGLYFAWPLPLLLCIAQGPLFPISRVKTASVGD